ncbi:MAG: hypothetical protein ACREBW_06935 [Candidatus Micrarchaeaceae archaeon]
MARLSYKTGKSVKEICIKEKILDRRTLDMALDVERMVFP